MNISQTAKLGEILFKEGLIKQSELSETLDLQKVVKRRLGELLLEKGYIDEGKLTEVLSRIFQIPFLRLSDTKLDPKVIALIPHDLLEMHKVIPISLNGQNLIVATNNPLDFAALQDIQYKSGYMVEPVMASLSDIEKHLQQYIDSLTSLPSKKSNSNQAMSTSQAPVVQMVESILRRAIKEKASDIHFEPQKDKMRVRFRIDGVLYERPSIAKDVERNVISRIKIISGMDVAENRRPQDGRATFSDGKNDYDIRISTLRNIIGENLVLRILNKQFVSNTFDSLGMDPHEVTIMNKLLSRPYGLILVTGPTGAGKTTTLYSMLNQLNKTSCNIVTVEDPVEYELAGINQTPINTMIGYTFATAIRHVLRHDPDVIMVGEIRDAETAEIAIRAALTGHLVISTMHTNTAAGAITRLLEMNIEPFLISTAVVGVIAQRLVRRFCPHCKKEYVPAADVLEALRKTYPFKDPVSFAQAAGCEQCVNTGYRGRVAVYEILDVNEEIRAKILKSTGEQDISSFAIKHGMMTLQQAALKKVGEKITSLEDAMRISIVD